MIKKHGILTMYNIGFKPAMIASLVSAHSVSVLGETFAVSSERFSTTAEEMIAEFPCRCQGQVGIITICHTIYF